MVATTIAIATETKQLLDEFKYPSETYNDLLVRLYKSASERQLQDLLMSEDGCMTLDEARAYIVKNG
jgi:hypothetical protein